MISVIIPTHNRKNNVELNLTNLTKQTLPKERFEVILIDDGSDDGTIELANIFKDKFQFKYAWLNKKDVWNASRPRNFGAKIAEKTSEAFVFVDSDILLNNQALEFYEQDLQKNKERVVVGPYDWLLPQFITSQDVINRFDDVINNKLMPVTVHGGLGYLGKDTRQVSFDKANSADDVFTEIYDGLACFGGNLMIPKNIFWKAGGYDENIFSGCEDGDFGLTLWETKIGFSYDKRTIGYHMWHPLSAHRSAHVKEDVDKLNLKHFGTTEQKLIDYTKEAFRRWGNDTWQAPPEWISQEGFEL